MAATRKPPPGGAYNTSMVLGFIQGLFWILYKACIDFYTRLVLIFIQA